MLKSSAGAKGLQYTDAFLQGIVEQVFREFDTNKDQVLSFSEFKKAVMSQQIMLNPFWTQTEFKFKDVQMARLRFCQRCLKPFVPK